MPENPSYTDESPAIFWKELSKKLAQLRNAISSGITFPFDYKAEKKDEFFRWGAFCIQHRKEVDDAVHRIISGKPNPPLSPEVKYLIGARLDAVGSFLLEFYWDRSGHVHTIFPKPSGTNEEILGKLLVDWWWGPGIHHSFHSRWGIAPQGPS